MFCSIASSKIYNKLSYILQQESGNILWETDAIDDIFNIKSHLFLLSLKFWQLIPY